MIKMTKHPPIPLEDRGFLFAFFLKCPETLMWRASFLFAFLHIPLQLDQF